MNKSGLSAATLFNCSALERLGIQPMITGIMFNNYVLHKQSRQHSVCGLTVTLWESFSPNWNSFLAEHFN